MTLQDTSDTQDFEPETEDRVYQIQISKAKRNLNVKSTDFSDEMYRAIFSEGLKSILNKGMSKIKVKDLEGDELDEARDEAFKQAEENLEALKRGELKKRRGGAAKDSRDVVMEARRLAKEAVKDAYRAANKKTTGIKASVFTASANELLESEDGEMFFEKARVNVEKMRTREKVNIKVTGKLAQLIASAETAKPRGAHLGRKKEGAATGDVVAARATQQKGRVQPSVRH